ncbi:glycine zipper 2TM domain-containing protein [Mesorhizobium sp. YM1C-6-2]|uniref:YMGG-like glycine zipper-containing protein n=1 Tax=Mesorhizobium sp. YM1C-6-2 TaxID=1827501 RepID=UPI000EF1C537|nr:glycine zipper 2TM domain-containing protein [Mesorhizobium sp. YM1C-6-2]RLP28053.1 glycine zipper 2TM domain-containing protein [Mesorhizobium sp. YM1C-6-2]
MNIARFAAIGAALLAATLAGCSETTSPQERSAGTGALVGAAGGALVGQALGRDTKSTLVGAAGGALLGAAVGTAAAPRRGEEMCRYRDYDGRVYVARCDDRYYRGRY